MVSITYVSKEERLKQRNERVYQLVIPMTASGGIQCNTCKSEKIPKIIAWNFNNENPSVDITFVCTDTRCTYAQGKQYLEKLYLVSAISNKDNDKFRQRITNIKGVGDAIANKLISAGYTSIEELTRATTPDLIAIGLREHQVSLLLSEF